MNKAGFGTRVMNFLIDTFLVWAITYGISSWWDFHVFYWNYPVVNFSSFFWGVLFVYYTLFEGFFKRSPAKWITFSKVMSSSGKKPAFWQILLRSLIRLTIIDCFFIPFLNKTLHDYASKTEVVQA